MFSYHLQSMKLLGTDVLHVRISSTVSVIVLSLVDSSFDDVILPEAVEEVMVVARVDAMLSSEGDEAIQASEVDMRSSECDTVAIFFQLCACKFVHE